MENKEHTTPTADESIKHHGDWASITAHELRTSLAANKWILKMFLDSDFGELTPEQSSFLKKVYDGNERMIRLVGDMLLSNHNQEQLITYRLESTHIEKIIEDVLFMFNAESYKKHIELVFLRPDSQLPEIVLDTDKMRIVFENVLENAIKYSNENDKVIISIATTDTDIRISITDTGIGIPEAEKAHIFEKSYRATNACKHEASGNGIGLYASKIIVEKHGGTLTFESTENKGTTMIITLPRIRIQS